MLDIKLLEIGYFLSMYGKINPPSELKVKKWKEAYLSFFQTLGLNKTEEGFINRLNNIRDHFDSHIDNSRQGWFNDKGEPDKLPEQYTFVLKYYEHKTRSELWEQIKPYQTSQHELNWKFDISTFRLLGKELITDRVTALVELVKNSYDANSKNVYLHFYNTTVKSKRKSKLIIQDDGFGMSSNDIKNKWMTIGTDSKRKDKFTPKPFNRRVVGEKGIGRFAIDKLGLNCRIYAKKEKEKALNLLSINWSDYENNDATDNFNKVTNHLKVKKFKNKCSGVKIVINNLHDVWSKSDLDRAYKELSKLVSPFNQLYPPFNIYISSNDYEHYHEAQLVKNEAIKFSTLDFQLGFDLKNKTQEIIKFQNEKLEKVQIPIHDFGAITFKLFYFNQPDKQKYKRRVINGSEQQIDGIKIYRDGILTTPFAENEVTQEKQRDILGLDKRRYSSFFDRVGTRDLLGVVEIKKDLSPFILDSTNRQDFIDNESYTGLKKFIIEQVQELEKYLKYIKKQDSVLIDEGLQEAKEVVEIFSSNLKILKNDIQEKNDINITQKIKSLEKSARDAGLALKKGIKQQKTERETSEQKEQMYMSLMSLQTYAIEITHIIKTSLSHIKQRAEFNIEFFNYPEQKQRIGDYNSDIMLEIDKLVEAIDFMSKYTRSDSNWEEFNIKYAFDSVFHGYSPILERDKIEIILDIQNNLIIDYNIILFEDIIKNLLNNSLKAISNEERKIVKITATAENEALTILFSDNGIGIAEEDRSKVFEVYHTTTAEEGGNGMGLYMIKTNINAIKGNIEIINSELEDGATFKITLPFKR
jgi:signal transduction histidine kinase